MSAIVRSFPLGPQWPTIDPFLFCAHHLDHYPPGTSGLGPEADQLSGRSIGQDFAGRDGWNMYHGSAVPGFPQHPHRGFETISYLRAGVIDHADSLGATARFGAGDVQWMTAGKGIVHSEMFPLLRSDDANPLHLFQIWLNLPAADKLVDPHFSMLWAETIPELRLGSSDGPGTSVTVVAGALGEATAPSPPPSSWAGRPEADVAIWHGEMEPGASLRLPPPASQETTRSLYVFAGGPLTVDGTELGPDTGAVLDPGVTEPELVDAGGGSSWMLLQGRPIGEPVAHYGPFVMNDRAQLEQAFVDYQRTQFGGWPWPADDPNHGPAAGRFAVHADGTKEEAPTR